MTDIILSFLHSFWNVLGQMAPYLLLGYIFAGVLSVFVTTDTVKRHLGGDKFASTLKAALFGMPLPLCSCSVIPVTASLHKSGAGKGAVASFLISTPTTGVDSIMAAWALMGPVFAIYRAIMSVLLGIITGVFVNIFDEGDAREAESGQEDVSEKTAECGCESKTESGESRIIKTLRYGLITVPKDLGKPLFIGIIIASIISALIDAKVVEQFLGAGIGTMVIMLAIGIPLYVCATASIPIAIGFMALGASPGAALVFLIAGPATNAATLAVLWKMIGKRATIIMLVTLFVGALLSGIILDTLWSDLSVSAISHNMHAEEHGGFLYSFFALVFVVVHVWAMFRGRVLSWFSGKEVVDSCCSRRESTKLSGSCCSESDGCMDSATRESGEDESGGSGSCCCKGK